MPDERLTSDELEYLCFGHNDVIVGDEEGAAVLQRQQFGEYRVGWLTLVVVHPARQGTGVGKELVGEVVRVARNERASQLLLASAVPRYLWPGVDVRNTRANMLLETCGFERDWVGTNMAMPTSYRHDPPSGVLIERETGRGARDFAQRAYAHWIPELDRAVELGTAFAARNKGGKTIGFGCHSVNRFGWVGPMATDPGLQHRGIGSALVSAICADLEGTGCPVAEVCWVSNFRFYGKCGAEVSRVFVGGKLPL